LDNKVIDIIDELL